MRTFQFAKKVRELIEAITKSLSNIEDIKQLVRASGSVGANYIEANEALGKKDFLMHIRISRKEAKESHYWLRLVNVYNDTALLQQKDKLVAEAQELFNIFNSILRKCSDEGK